MFSNMDLMDTLGVVGYEGCHFNRPATRTSCIGSRRWWKRNFYGVKSNAVVTAPNLVRAYYTTTARTRLPSSSTRAMSWNTYAKANFYLDNVAGKVSSAAPRRTSSAPAHLGGGHQLHPRLPAGRALELCGKHLELFSGTNAFPRSRLPMCPSRWRAGTAGHQQSPARHGPDQWRHGMKAKHLLNVINQSVCAMSILLATSQLAGSSPLAVPQRGFVSSQPANIWEEGLILRERHHGANALSRPLNERIIFTHERLFMPMGAPVMPPDQSARLFEIRA